MKMKWSQFIFTPFAILSKIKLEDISSTYQMSFMLLLNYLIANIDLKIFCRYIKWLREALQVFVPQVY